MILSVPAEPQLVILKKLQHGFFTDLYSVALTNNSRIKWIRIMINDNISLKFYRRSSVVFFLQPWKKISSESHRSLTRTLTSIYNIIRFWVKLGIFIAFTKMCGLFMSVNNFPTRNLAPIKTNRNIEHTMIDSDKGIFYIPRH